MEAVIKFIGFVLILAANILYAGNYHFSNYHCGTNDELFEIWNMNAIALAFVFMSLASILPYKYYGTYTLFLNMVLYCSYDFIMRYHSIYTFHKYDVYAIIFSPIFSALFSILFYNYVIKPTKGNEP